MRRFAADESGATAVEYGLIAGMVSVAIVATLTLAGGDLRAFYDAMGVQLQAAFASTG
jgi:pilus assembly protein Flp/PilA